MPPRRSMIPRSDGSAEADTGLIRLLYPARVRNFATACGVVTAMLLVLWPAGCKEGEQAQTPTTVESPVAEAGRAGPRLYRLTGQPLSKGSKLHEVGGMTMDLSGQIISAGRVMPATMAAKNEETSSREILDADDLGPTRIRITYVSQRNSTRMKVDGHDAADETTPGPLHGRTVLAERADGRWRLRLEGPPATPEQQRKLDAMYLGTDEAYPAREVEVGHSWEIEGPALRRLLNEQKASSLTGRVRVKFERVTHHAGEECAEVSFAGDVAGTETNQQGDAVQFRMGLHGTVFRSLRNHSDLSTEYAGTMDMEGEGVRTSKNWYSGTKRAKSSVKLGGPIKVSQTVTLVPPGGQVGW